MPAKSNVVQPPGETGNPETAPEHLALQASPDTVEFAERAHQVFLESLQSKLSVALGVDTRASFVRIEQSFMARYLTGTAPGIHNVILSLEPLTGCVLLRFSSEVLFKVLDILLASPAAADGPRGESVTEIELHILRRFFQVFSETLKEAWRVIPPIALTPVPASGDESLLNYGDSNSLAMISALEIDGAAGDFTVVIPAFLARLSMRLSRLKPDETVPAQDGKLPPPTKITEALGYAKVDVEAVLSNLTIRFGDLVDLVPGQIILGEKTVDSTFECFVNKRNWFRGELVPAGDRYGFQLTRTGAVDEETDSPADR